MSSSPAAVSAVPVRSDEETNRTGLYECLLTEELRAALADYALERREPKGERDLLFALLYRQAAAALRRALVDELSRENEKESVAKARVLVERVLRDLAEPSHLTTPFEILLAADEKHPATGALRWADVIRPATSFSQTTLFTGARGEPVLLDELRRETLSADTADWLVSFLKMSGLRPMMQTLQAFTNRGGRLRVITTTYVGATDPEAVLWLTQLPNTEVYVSYDTEDTRHHAKAYLFSRRNGLSTAYAGSANLSAAALRYGLEWTVKVTESSDPAMLERMKTIFASYLTDEARFRRFDPARDEALLRESVAQARAGGRNARDAAQRGAVPLSVFGIELRPYPFQAAILEKLEAARSLHSETRSLVVAATGTGKTMIAAFDYRRQCRKAGWRVRMLFVAHREEILQQALTAFRYVLNDMNFGELFTGKETPTAHEHVFLSVQTAASRRLADFYAPDHFEYVVIDEFHHAEAKSYRALLDTLNPRLFLGLTATPWRGDGRDVLARFNGHITAELGLAEAIDRQLLVPFDYLMVTDPVALTALRWQRGGYLAADLENAYLEGKNAAARDRVLLDAVRRYLPDLSDVRGLVFCAGRRHAAHIAKLFQEAGVPAELIDGTTDAATRRSAPERLRSGKVRFLCTVDVYNEGVDIPEVNTVLFLRPTASPTVFLQQLGRGLRKASEKIRLTVLDFVGAAKKEFSFEARLRCLLRGMRGDVVSMVKDADSSSLPLGCTVTLEKQAMTYVLENIKAHRKLSGQLAVQAADWLVGVPRETEPRFVDFLRDQRLSPAEWPDLVRKAVPGKAEAFFEDVLAQVAPDRFAPVPVPEGFSLSKGAFRRLFRKNGYASLCGLIRDMEARKPFAELPPLRQADWETLAYTWCDQTEQDVKARGGNRSAAEALYTALLDNPVWAKAVRNVFEALLESIDFVSPPANVPEDVPLELHAEYSSHEALAALGYKSAYAFREGVKYLSERRTDVFFVTIDKEERHFAVSNRYDDYAMNAAHFHWQSQSTTRAESEAGRRYRWIGRTDAPSEYQGQTAHLFVRERKVEKGVAVPFVYLGRVRFVSSEGECPMSIVWALETPIPPRWLDRFMR